MALTTGIVQSLNITTEQACVHIGSSPTNAEVLVVNISSADDTAVIAFQTSIVDALAAALASNLTVAATHGDHDAIVAQIVINPV